jgi:hypothetical protein
VNDEVVNEVDWSIDREQGQLIFLLLLVYYSFLNYEFRVDSQEGAPVSLIAYLRGR